MKIGVIGGGAAGFFSAIQCKLNNPSVHVTILEKSAKLLAKVKISGGGRCNVTNIESDREVLAKCYPRGGKQLKKAFREFSTPDTISFFEERNVPLITQEDGCIFPVSQNSQTIIDCFLEEAHQLGIEIKMQQRISKIKQNSVNNSFEISCEETTYSFDKVIVCTGGSPKLSGYDWLAELGQPIIPPIPSLFTFNMPKESIKTLMGIVVPNAITKIQGTKLVASGPLLITHWGMSGPAILVLSAWGARILEEKKYQFNVSVNWSGITNEEDVREKLIEIQNKAENAQLKKFGVFEISQRLWEFLLNRWGVSSILKWNELGKKNFNRIINGLTNDVYSVSGKTTFKEEFVTAGGVDLKFIDFKTMQSKCIPNLYFAGEVLDIDGITGGFNFQAAWTTGYLAGKGASLRR